MKSVCFCSSQRFKEEMESFISELRFLARVRGEHITIFHPQFEDKPKDFLGAHEKERLARDEMYRVKIAGVVYDHLFRKLRIADVVFLFNKDGYLGVNTSGELFAAAALGKPVYSLEGKFLMGTYPHDLYEEPAPPKLVHEVVSKPEELLKRLM